MRYFGTFLVFSEILPVNLLAVFLLPVCCNMLPMYRVKFCHAERKRLLFLHFSGGWRLSAAPPAPPVAHCRPPERTCIDGGPAPLTLNTPIQRHQLPPGLQGEKMTRFCPRRHLVARCCHSSLCSCSCSPPKSLAYNNHQTVTLPEAGRADRL